MSRSRAMLAAAFAVAGSLLAGCGGTSVPSVAPTASPTIQPILSPSNATLPTLPAGWVRYEASGAFTVGAPAAWLVITPVERDDATATAALMTAHPDFAKGIETAVVQMRAQGTYLQAFDVAGDTTTFTTNMNVLRVPGPLTSAFATASAATVQAQFELADPLAVEAVARPAGAYRYQFAEDLQATSLAGMQYLIPAGSDVYVMTFLTTVERTEGYGPTALGMAETFAAVVGGSAVVDPTPAVDPMAGFDPITGILLDPSVPDGCAVLPAATVGAATGYPKTAADTTYFKNACRYIDRNLNRADAVTAVNRYIDIEHARAAARLRATTPSDSGRPWVSLPGYDDLFYATGNGEIVAVSGAWLVMINVVQVGPDGAGTLTEVAKLLAAKLAANLDRL